MSKNLTILFTPMDAFGHVNPAIGIAEQLHERGHRIVFAVDQQWQNRLKKHGFEEEILISDISTNEAQSGALRNMFKTEILRLPTSLDKIVKVGNMFKVHLLTRIKLINDQMKSIVERVKPDVIVFDNTPAIPALFLADCAKVMMIPSNPLTIIGSDLLPPPTSGYPTDDKSEWSKFNEIVDQILKNDFDEFNKWIMTFGLPALPKNFCFNNPTKPDLTIYCFPKELDYHGVNGWQKQDNWLRFDSFIRDGNEEFELPEKLKKCTGKLIFLSMGSIGCVDIELNKRLLELLADTDYRVIVVKGPFADQFEVPDNAWGQAMLPQTKVLPLVDLVITHGGNNSLCEVFYFGKPMIVMPLFYDQYDNGQRVVETGLGIRLDPFQCSKQELLEAIDKLLNDKQLAGRLKKISERAQEEVKTMRLAKVIEEIAEKASVKIDGQNK